MIITEESDYPSQGRIVVEKIFKSCLRNLLVGPKAPLRNGILTVRAIGMLAVRPTIADHTWISPHRLALIA